jgi:imidazolonepropionase-like amidohydrolase
MQVRFTFLFLVAGFLVRSRACAEIKPLLKEMDAAPLVLIGGSILPFPDATPIPDGVIVIESGKITAFGRSGAVIPPSNAATLDCRGDTIVAGFWNCHVHFTERKWADAAHRPAEQLARDLQQMLTSQGFTAVVDEGSILPNTLSLRQRIEAGEAPGPRIFTAGIPLFPKDGIPWYVTESLAPEVVKQLYVPASAEEAIRDVDENVAGGADLVKLFLVTGVRENGKIVLRNMDIRIVLAATNEAHRLGKLVVVHPSNINGVELALAGHVDILGHTIQDPENWTPAVVSRLIAAHVSLIPTLTLFGPTGNFSRVVSEVKSYTDAGGQVLFGTDVGFLTDYQSLSREFSYLGEAGLTLPQLLETLTTAPAERFGYTGQASRIAVGADADLVILHGTPLEGPRILSRVAYTLRKGRILYSSPQ